MMVLQGRFRDLFVMLAPVCSSWSTVNVASSRRSLLTPLGNTFFASVRRGNRMVTRTGDWGLFGHPQQIDLVIPKKQNHKIPNIHHP